MKSGGFTCKVRDLARTYTVTCIIVPPHPAPHCGADSPRYLSPGSRARVTNARVLDEHGIEITGTFTPLRLEMIADAVRRAAVLDLPEVGLVPSFLPSSSLHPRRRCDETDQFPLPLGGHLRRAMERTL